MGFFIYKIFNGQVDDSVHLRFQTFSRGDFKNRAMVVAKAQAKGVYRIGTTPEYGNELVRYFAEKLGENSTRVTGIIVSTRDLTGELDFQNKKQFMGVKQYILDREMSGTEILELCDKLPQSFMGLSFKVGDSELKIKPKAPKSAKPGTKGDKNIKVNFCRIKTKDIGLINSLIFDQEAKGFKEIWIDHEFIIDEIVISDELKAEAGDDYKKIKEMALRKGKIIRKINVDGREIKKEKEFAVQISLNTVRKVYDKKNAPLQKVRKLHIACLKNSKVIAYAKATIGTKHDSPFFEEVINAIVKNGFQIKTLLADARYNSKNNYALCKELGILNVFIDFKKNSVSRRAKSDLWREKLKLYKEQKNIWNQTYRFRVIVEGIFSAIKKKNLNYLRSKKDNCNGC